MSKTVDKRGQLEAEPFSYRANKDGKVFVAWNGKQVMILKDKAAKEFLTKVKDKVGKPAQLVMAKVTGNFKHGNER